MYNNINTFFIYLFHNTEYGRVIGGLSSEDPYITSYQEFIDKKPNAQSKKRSILLEQEKDQSEIDNMNGSNMAEESACTGEGEFDSYLNRYTSQRVLSKSLLSNMGKSMRGNFH